MGKWGEEEKEERFECARCGTVFLAGKHEFVAERQERCRHVEEIRTAKCPVCGDNVNNREWLY